VFFFKEKINGIKSQIAALEANHQARMNKVSQVNREFLSSFNCKFEYIFRKKKV